MLLALSTTDAIFALMTYGKKEGYLKVLPGMQDSRTRRVNLTTAGKKAQKAAMPYWRKAQHEMVDYLGKSNAKQFISDLQVAAKSREQI